MHFISSLFLTLSITFIFIINNLKEKKLVSVKQIKIYFLIFILNFNSYIKFFINVSYINYNLVLNLL